jgi:hypothetical protein
MPDTIEITDQLLINALTRIGGEGTGHEIFRQIGKTSSYYKDLIRIHLDRMATRGLIVKIPASSLVRPLVAGNRGSIKWAYRLSGNATGHPVGVQ